MFPDHVRWTPVLHLKKNKPFTNLNHTRQQSVETVVEHKKQCFKILFVVQPPSLIVHILQYILVLYTSSPPFRTLVLYILLQDSNGISQFSIRDFSWNVPFAITMLVCRSVTCSPKDRDHPKRKLIIFQPLIFWKYVSFNTLFFTIVIDIVVEYHYVHYLGRFFQMFNMSTQGFERLATSQLLSATSCDARACRVTAEAKSGANPSLGKVKVGRLTRNQRKWPLEILCM